MSYMYGFLAALFFAIANVCNAEVSKAGFDSIWTFWLGTVIPFFAYHGYYFIIYQCQGKKYFDYEKSNYVLEY